MKILSGLNSSVLILSLKAAESVSLSNYCMWIFHCYKKLHMTKLSLTQSQAHTIRLKMSFGCWHMSGIPLFPLHFTVYTMLYLGRNSFLLRLK